MGGKKLIIHIGFPKSGSTAIQDFLYTNSNTLMQYGWCYPDLPGIPDEIYHATKTASGPHREKNGSVFTDCKNYAKLVSSDSKQWKIAVEELERALHKYHTIISAEGFARKTVLYEFVRRMKERFDNCFIIAYIRRQDLYDESAWKQAVKENATFRSLCQMDQSFFESCGFEMDYYSIFSQVAEIVGKERVIIRIFEKDQMYERSLIKDFFHAIGINPNWNDFRVERHVNKSVHGDYLDILRIINPQIKDKKGVGDYGKSLIECSERYGGASAGQSFFTSEQREVLVNRYLESNKKLAWEFLGREDGKLFCTDIQTEEWEMGFSEKEENIIRAFGALLLEREALLQQQIDRNLFFMRMIPYWMRVVEQKKNRKLAFWGAGNRCRELCVVFGKYIDIIFDNNLNKKGAKIADIEIEYPSADAIQTEIKEYYIVVTVEKYEDIAEQLIGYGLKEESDFSLAWKWWQ